MIELRHNLILSWLYGCKMFGMGMSLKRTLNVNEPGWIFFFVILIVRLVTPSKWLNYRPLLLIFKRNSSRSLKPQPLPKNQPLTRLGLGSSSKIAITKPSIKYPRFLDFSTKFWILPSTNSKCWHQLPYLLYLQFIYHDLKYHVWINKSLFHCVTRINVKLTYTVNRWATWTVRLLVLSLRTTYFPKPDISPESSIIKRYMYPLVKPFQTPRYLLLNEIFCYRVFLISFTDGQTYLWCVPNFTVFCLFLCYKSHKRSTCV